MTEAALHYDTESRGLGQEFLDDVQHSVDTARQQPEASQWVGDGLRRIVFRRFPFLLIFAREFDEIVVVAVAHQRRRPGYWRERIPR